MFDNFTQKFPRNYTAAYTTSNFMSDIEYSVITSDVIKSFDCILI